MKVREINYINGQDCGAGYDVHQYVSDDGRSAALIKRLSDKTQIFVDCSDSEDVENACFHFANGADIPAESEEGAEALWDELDKAFAGQE